jgi:hypothetical protein
MYDALCEGRVKQQRLRRSLASLPGPGWVSYAQLRMARPSITGFDRGMVTARRSITG